jgi:hypothetical protein
MGNGNISEKEEKKIIIENKYFQKCLHRRDATLQKNWARTVKHKLRQNKKKPRRNYRRASGLLRKC